VQLVRVDHEPQVGDQAVVDVHGEDGDGGAGDADRHAGGAVDIVLDEFHPGIPADEAEEEPGRLVPAHDRSAISVNGRPKMSRRTKATRSAGVIESSTTCIPLLTDSLRVTQPAGSPPPAPPTLVQVAPCRTGSGNRSPVLRSRRTRAETRGTRCVNHFVDDGVIARVPKTPSVACELQVLGNGRRAADGRVRLLDRTAATALPRRVERVLPLRLLPMSDVDKDTEISTLRHQLAFLQQQIDRPRFS